jgi:hypothetical protein
MRRFQRVGRASGRRRFDLPDLWWRIIGGPILRVRGAAGQFDREGREAR